MSTYPKLDSSSPFQALLTSLRHRYHPFFTQPLNPSRDKCLSTTSLRLSSTLLLTTALILLSNACFHRLLFKPYLDPSPLLPNSRFTHAPVWRTRYAKPLTLPPSLQQSQYRAYWSILPDTASDGMGNGFTAVNYELLLSHLLNVTYIHRVARYGSLSTDHDPLAVERLFGWDDHPYIRSEMAGTICAEVEMQYAPNCPQENVQRQRETGAYPVCKRLRKDAPFKRIVNIPGSVAGCLIGRMTSQCKRDIMRFASDHPKEGTLFQLVPDKCGNIYRNPDFRRTGEWFRHMYWKRHRESTAVTRGENVTRVIKGFDGRKVQVAVHIRRGDFFVSKSRVLIADAAYADVMAAVARVTRKVHGDGVGVGATIYSEGVPVEGASLGHEHDMSRMESIYEDENQTRHGDGWQHWKDLMRERGAEWVDISMQVGTDTIEAIHGMSCADVFIGSMSSMSRTLVGELARGVVILPSVSDQLDEYAKKHDWRIYYGYDGPEGAIVDYAAIQQRIGQVFNHGP